MIVTRAVRLSSVARLRERKCLGKYLFLYF